MRLLLNVAMITAAMTLMSNAQACTTGDIRIEQFTWRPDIDGWIKVVGQIRNLCPTAVGAELQITFKDKSGAVSDVDEFWPASTRNIASGGAYPFAKTYETRHGAIGLPTETAIIDVRQWR